MSKQNLINKITNKFKYENGVCYQAVTIFRVEFVKLEEQDFISLEKETSSDLVNQLREIQNRISNECQHEFETQHWKMFI